MATTVQFRRKNTSNTAAFTGANGEISVDTDKKTLVVHDGATAGGVELMRADANNASINSLSFSATVVANGTGLFVGTSTTNSTVNTSTIVVSNSTQSTTIGTGSFAQGNSTANVVANTSTIVVSNTTSSVSINPALVTTPGANVTSNTGLKLGSSNVAANGYTFLPNGLKLVWGWASVNSTVSTITYANSFSSAVYSITATAEVGSSGDSTYDVLLLTSNTTAANVKTSNATASNVRYMVIGV